MLNASLPKGEASATPSNRDAAGAAPLPSTKKKFHNGWTREIELLMAKWADTAICYRWMHDKTERQYKTKDMGFMFPVIILSTVTGAANFAMDSVLENPEHKKYAQLGLGGLSIATGIISTIANRLGYASGSEAHKGAGVLWGKFQRLITIELSLHPNERTDCMTFLKICRTELDRLIEQSPSIPDTVIAACRDEFKQYPNVKKPEIVGDIDTTKIFVDTNSRLKELARDAALMLHTKKGTLKQIVLDDLEPRINRVIENSTLPAIKEELRRDIQRAAEKATRDAIGAVAAGRATAATATGATVLAADVATRAAERTAEVQRIAESGVVSEMRRKLAEAAAKMQGPATLALGMQGPVALPGLMGTFIPPETEEVVVHVADVEESDTEVEVDDSALYNDTLEDNGEEATTDEKC